MGLGTGDLLIVLDEVDSTNRDALERAADGAPHGTVVVARRQTAGRGRQGRSWLSGDGALTLSVIVRGHGVDGLLPLRAGLAVARTAGSAARVKWPNDVLVDGRKVAGILVESAGDGAAVVGIGVNVAPGEAELAPELAGRAGTLGRSVDELDAVRDELLVHLTDAMSLDAPTVVAALAARGCAGGPRDRVERRRWWRAPRGACRGHRGRRPPPRPRRRRHARAPHRRRGAPCVSLRP